MNSATRFARPTCRADWRALALGLAALPADQAPVDQRAEFKRLRDTAWDVASHAAFWRTVQLPSLGPGLLPWMVLVVVMIVAVVSGHLPDGWPDLANPFFLWPSLWLLAWFAFTFILATVRHRRAQSRVLALGAQLSVFPPSALSA